MKYISSYRNASSLVEDKVDYVPYLVAYHEEVDVQDLRFSVDKKHAVEDAIVKKAEVVC